MRLHARFRMVIPVDRVVDWYARRVARGRWHSAARKIQEILAGRSSPDESVFRPAGVTVRLARLTGSQRRWTHAARALALLLTMAQASAPDSTVVPTRTGNHPGYGRIVFDAPPKARYTLTRDGDTIAVRFQDDFRLDRQQSVPRNVTRLTTAAAVATFSVNAGTTLRQTRLGNRVVIDIVDPAAPETSQSAGPRPMPALAAPSADPKATPSQQSARTSPQTPGLPPIQRATALPIPPRTAEPPVITPRSTRAGPGTPGTPQPGPVLGAPPAASPAQPTGGPATVQPPARTPEPSQAGSPPIIPAVASDTPTVSTAPEPGRHPRDGSSGTDHTVPAIATAPVVAVTRDPALSTTPSVQPPEPPATAPGSTDPIIQPQAAAVPRVPTSGPIALVVRRTAAVPGLEGPGVMVPFASSVGAAVFRRGSAVWIVFDERRLLDLAALRGDPVFAGASTQLVPGGAVIRVPLPEGKSVTVSRSPQAWKIALALTPQDPHAIVPVVAEGRMTFLVESASDVISLADPQSGSTLLVGTQRKANQAVVTSRRTTEFSLIPTQLGVVVEPLSDILSFRTIPTGFLLTGGSRGLMLSSPSYTNPLKESPIHGYQSR